MSNFRKALFAETFYEADGAVLKRQLSGFLEKDAAKEDAIACVLPHAGYIYSGRVATQTAAALNVKENIFLLGPNHTGLGQRFSVTTMKSWMAPFGACDIQAEAIKALLKNCPLLTADDRAHMYEHSIEVQLPILQFVSSAPFRLIPIVVSEAEDLEYGALGLAIAKTIKQLHIEESSLIVASSDFTHYEHVDQATEKDNIAVDAILKLDEALLLKRVQQHNISMCGSAPIAVMLTAAKKLGATKARVIRYQTSGETTGDYKSVVGYAGIVIA